MRSNEASEKMNYERMFAAACEALGEIDALLGIGDYEVSLNGGNAVVYHLKVLEVWVKKGKRWLLFARQAVRG